MCIHTKIDTKLDHQSKIILRQVSFTYISFVSWTVERRLHDYILLIICSISLSSSVHSLLYVFNNFSLIGVISLALNMVMPCLPRNPADRRGNRTHMRVWNSWNEIARSEELRVRLWFWVIAVRWRWCRIRNSWSNEHLSDNSHSSNWVRNANELKPIKSSRANESLAANGVHILYFSVSLVCVMW